MTAGARIVAMGHYQPSRVVTNDDLSATIDTPHLAGEPAEVDGGGVVAQPGGGPLQVADVPAVTGGQDGETHGGGYLIVARDPVGDSAAERRATIQTTAAAPPAPAGRTCGNGPSSGC